MLKKKERSYRNPGYNSFRAFEKANQIPVDKGMGLGKKWKDTFFLERSIEQNIKRVSDKADAMFLERKIER